MLFVPGLHFGHEVGCFLFGDGWWTVVVIIIVEDHWEHVGDSLALWVAHGVDGCVGTLGYELVLQAVAAAVASDDAQGLPVTDFIEKFASGNSYLAHEQFVDVVGDC